MTIIDRYLLRQFLRTFGICYVSLFGLFVVFDAFTNLEGFLRFAEKHGGLLAVMSEFYSYRAIFFFDRMAGLLVLAAAMFTAAWLHRHQELTALMAAGIPRVRVVVPIVAAAAVIVLAAAANRELVLPRFRNELARSPKELSGDAPRKVQSQSDPRTDVFIQGETAVADGQRIEKPDFRLPSSLEYYTRQVTARQAYYRPAEGNKPGGFLLDGVEQPKDIATRPSLYLGEQLVILTPSDAKWLLPDQCFIVSDVTFEQLTEQQSWREFSSTAQLIAALRGRNPGFGGGVRVAIHGRFVQPLLDMTLLFLGLPLVVARDNRNVFVALGLCGAVVAVFLLVVMGSQAAGRDLLIRPALAAWLPLMIFAPVAVEMAYSMRR
jgi:lipopolysaccharide export system permease protein